MAKDPAFLFYSKDFYEGTRMMLPTERACYIDLMVYQHQNGIIPNDIPRLLMYCSGVDEATLKAVLKAKFKEASSGWVSERLENVIKERQDYKEKQSVSGQIGQFWKQSKKILKPTEYNKLRKSCEKYTSNELLSLIIENKSNPNELAKAMLKAPLKHLEDVDVIENEIEYPWEGENFKKAWAEWKAYKKEQFKFNYKPRSERAALTELNKLTSNEEMAIRIIHQSISNGWKGFFELKNNGSTTENGSARSALEIIASRN